MSKIGKKAIALPKDVKLNIEYNSIECQGKLGSIKKKIDLSYSKIDIQEDKVLVLKSNNDKKLKSAEDKKSRQMHGTVRQIINSCIEGVTKGFKRVLITIGVGYRAEVKKCEPLNFSYLSVFIGKSYVPKVIIPEGLEVKVDKRINIEIFGVDKEKVSQFAAILQSLRKREPYKGKGILTPEEKLIPLKSGKTKSK